jgi:hypothetical protein
VAVPEIFLFSAFSNSAVGPTHSPNQWVPSFIFRMQRPGREAELSPPAIAEIEDAWSFPSPLTCPYGVTLN